MNQSLNTSKELELKKKYCLIDSTLNTMISDHKKSMQSNNTNEDFFNRVQEVFEYLAEQVSNFDFNNVLSFLCFESLFFKLIHNYFFQFRDADKSPKLINLNSLKGMLSEPQFNYISIIYEAIQFEFDYWINYRNGLSNDIKKIETYNHDVDAEIDLINHLDPRFMCSELFWNNIRFKAESAYKEYQFGELAKRLIFISNIQLLYNRNYSEQNSAPNDELAKEIVKLNYDIDSFVEDCFGEKHSRNLEWLTGYPYIFQATSILESHKSVTELAANMNDCLDFAFNNIVFLGSGIYNFRLEQILSDLIYTLSQINNDLEITNKELHSAQEKQKQIIAEFAHTYGNMQATTLQDIGTELLGVDDELFHEWGKKIMVEYAIKQNLTKEVEMLKLQFEDQSSALIQKLQDSISNDGKNISDLVSDSLQRCFMSLLYGETSQDKSKRNLFWGTDDFAERRKALQESFEEKVLVGKEKALSWLDTNHILNISLEISGIWRTLRFEDGGYAALLLTNWITELLTNAIKYADKSKTIILSFAQIDEMLSIKIQNIKEPSVVHIHGTQQGVSSIIASVCRLNQAVNCDKGVEIKNDEADAYKLQLFLSSKVISG